MTTSLQPSIDKFTSEPDAARTQPTVTATLANGHARLSAGPFNWEADLPPAVGGHNQSPSPTAYLLGALAGCAVTFINDTLAPEFDVTIDQVKAWASCSADLAGLLGIAGHNAALADLSIRISVESQSDADQVIAMQEAWKQRCPVLLALVNPNSVDLTFS